MLSIVHEVAVCHVCMAQSYAVNYTSFLFRLRGGHQVSRSGFISRNLLGTLSEEPSNNLYRI